MVVELPATSVVEAHREQVVSLFLTFLSHLTPVNFFSSFPFLFTCDCSPLTLLLLTVVLFCIAYQVYDMNPVIT